MHNQQPAFEHNIQTCINPNFWLKIQKTKELYTLDNSKYILDHFTSVGLEEEGIDWRFRAF